MNYQKAINTIDKQEKTKDNQYKKAVCYKVLGNITKAITLLKELDKKYPNDISIKIELAQCYEKLKDWNHLSGIYTNLEELDNDNLFFTIKKSEANLNALNYREAISNLQNVLKQDSLLTAINLLGKVYDESNNLDSAMYYYNLEWTKDSTNVLAAINVINTSIRLHDYGAAKKYSEDYLKIDSTSYPIKKLYGYSLYFINDYENASKVLEKCYLSGDSSLIITRVLGNSLFYIGRSNLAYDYLKKAYKEDTTNLAITYNLAVAAQDLKKYDEVVVYYKNILNQMIPSDATLYLNYKGLAVGYEGQKDYENATDNYAKALNYATENQKMDLLATLSRLWDKNLKNYQMAMMYYKDYQRYLDKYIKYYEKNDPNFLELELYQRKYKELEEYLKILNTQIVE